MLKPSSSTRCRSAPDQPPTSSSVVMLVHPRPWRQLEHGRRSRRCNGPCSSWPWHADLRRWRAIPKRGVRPRGVEAPPPSFDNYASLREGVEDLAVEEFIPQSRVEALDEAILPWTALRDIGGLGADCCDPFLHRRRDKFGGVAARRRRRAFRSYQTSIQQCALQDRSTCSRESEWRL